MKCDKCLHSRAIVSENGIHCVCTLSSKTATKCLTGENDRFYARRKEKKLMTNADRIRSMSDEELAEFICAVSDDDEGAKMVECHYFPVYSIYDILEWLNEKSVEVE